MANEKIAIINTLYARYIISPLSPTATKLFY